MKVNDSLVNGIILLLIGGLGTLFWYSFNTVQETKEQTLIVKENFVDISNKLDIFSELQKEQNVNMNNINKRIDAVSDSIAIHNIKNIKDHDKVFKSINQIIYIENKTDKKFHDLYNYLNLTYCNNEK